MGIVSGSAAWRISTATNSPTALAIEKSRAFNGTSFGAARTYSGGEEATPGWRAYKGKRGARTCGDERVFISYCDRIT
jgi:hypothetical protein